MAMRFKIKISLLFFSIFIFPVSAEEVYFKNKCLINTDTKHNCVGSTLLEKNIKYFGGFKNNQPHGAGTIRSEQPNNDFFIRGIFKNGKLNGHGYIELSKGSLSGYGPALRPGTALIGIFKNNIPDGRAFVSTPEGNRVYGRYQNGKLTKGTIIFPPHHAYRYYGDIKNLLPHGKGYQISEIAHKDQWGNKTYQEFYEGKRVGKYIFSENPNGNRFGPDGYFIDDHNLNTTIKRVFQKIPEAARMLVQIGLIENNYYKKKIDGKWGPGTNTAIIEYANSRKKAALFHSEEGVAQLFTEIAVIGEKLWKEYVEYQKHTNETISLTKEIERLEREIANSPTSSYFTGLGSDTGSKRKISSDYLELSTSDCIMGGGVPVGLKCINDSRDFVEPKTGLIGNFSERSPGKLLGPTINECILSGGVPMGNKCM